MNLVNAIQLLLQAYDKGIANEEEMKRIAQALVCPDIEFRLSSDSLDRFVTLPLLDRIQISYQFFDKGLLAKEEMDAIITGLMKTVQNSFINLNSVA